MNVFGTPGRILFTIAIACFGAHYLAYASGTSLAPPGPPWFPDQRSLSWAVGAALLAAALCLALEWKPRSVALLLGTALLLRVVFIHIPRILLSVHNPGPWTSLGEILSISGGAFVISITESIFRTKMSTRLAQCLFALPLFIFGAQHVLYGHFVATLIPDWIPARLFWAYFIGIAFILAALAIIFRRLALPAASLLGVMFFSWVVILHGPRVAAAARNGNEWTSLFVALAMAGSAWSVAGTFASKK